MLFSAVPCSLFCVPQVSFLLNGNNSPAYAPGVCDRTHCTPYNRYPELICIHLILKCRDPGPEQVWNVSGLTKGMGAMPEGQALGQHLAGVPSYLPQRQGSQTTLAQPAQG